MTVSYMKAIRYRTFGGPEVLELESIPRPEPRDGEVLVRVMAAGVLPVDWKIRKGWMPGSVALPCIPGSAFAGIVERVGGGVGELHAGQLVFGKSENGTYAEYTVAAAASVAPMPPSLGFEEAAALQGGATTAWRAVQDAGVKAGDRVLIHGAAGGVGLFAAQFAKRLGARVIGTAGPANQAFLSRELGVDEAIDYTAGPFEQIAGEVDFVLDTVGGETLERSWSVVRRGGVLISIAGRPPAERGEALGVRVMRPGPATSRDLSAIAALLEEGAVRAFVQRTFPLAEAREAHALSESGHGRGRIVLGC